MKPREFLKALSDLMELSLKNDALKPVRIKLSILQNKTFAYHTNLRAISDSFLKANISTAEIRRPAALNSGSVWSPELLHLLRVGRFQPA